MERGSVTAFQPALSPKLQAHVPTAVLGSGDDGGGGDGAYLRCKMQNAQHYTKLRHPIWAIYSRLPKYKVN